MKKKLLVLLIAVIPTLMPNLVSAVEIEIEIDEEDLSVILHEGQCMGFPGDCLALLNSR